jgi:hypothetical protein
MNRSFVLRGVFVLFTLVFFAPGAAQAKGVILITWGDTISHLGDVAPQHRPHAPLKQVGFKSSYFGVFWLDLWTWGGEYCIYEDKKYISLEPAGAAHLMGVSESDLRKPFLYTFPLGLLILGPLLVIGVLVKVFSPPEKDSIGPLFQDERYQQALQIMTAHFAKPEHAADQASPPPEADKTDSPEKTTAAEPKAADDERFSEAFEAGVQHLVGVGIPRDEAERNLGAMVQVMMAAARE